ncbi:methyltransferase domain-containing protein [Spirillospora sp. NPDC048819]|uniref:class I SAM-dependent methyltransferase n=1 Tax=Spirillospora sp. NPDC048819 TaxID=3155268 RepID=UPI0033EF3CB3
MNATSGLRPPPVFGGHDDHNGEQHRLLGLAFDPLTKGRLAQTGIGPGWRCLEVGAGDGGVAAWLARRVAPTGGVLATDIRPVRRPAVAGLEFLRHDIVRDPLPEAEFDLVHARLVLRLLPDRLAVLDRLVRALKPGGVLQVDEFDATDAPALRVPDPAAHRLYRTFMDTKARIMNGEDVDTAWGRKAAAAMRRSGLTGISSLRRSELWSADSPGLQLLSHHTRHLREIFVRAGMTDRQLAEVRELLAHPGFRARSYAIYSVQGRRPRERR